MPSSSCRTRTPLLPTTKVNEGRRDRGGAREMGKRVGSRNSNESALTRWVRSVFGFVKFAEFEILFVLFFVIAFLVFKDLKQGENLKEQGFLEPQKIVALVFLDRPAHDGLNATVKEK
ncbi:hypothetical protein ACE6H2_009477 [Prunus campanulata]